MVIDTAEQRNILLYVYTILFRRRKNTTDAAVSESAGGGCVYVCGRSSTSRNGGKLGGGAYVSWDGRRPRPKTVGVVHADVPLAGRADAVRRSSPLPPPPPPPRNTTSEPFSHHSHAVCVVSCRIYIFR